MGKFNQEFLDKYQSNRHLYIKDHFLIQNGKTIQLADGKSFDVTLSMNGLKKRAYNFVYHKDIYGNLDFVSRLNMIYASASETSLEQRFDQYELDYFNFVSEQIRSFYMNDVHMPTWDEAVEEYKKDTIRDFPKIIAYILQERCSTWNKTVGAHINNQLEI